MRAPVALALFAALLVPSGIGGAIARAQGASEGTGARACVVHAELGGTISGGTADFLDDAIAATVAQRCDALLVTVDTPGGMIEPTRRIVRAFLEAPVPVVAYVAPAAARAGSAGAFVVLSAHVAAMAPGASIGAAHPVMMPGGDRGPDEELARKIENDVAALARAIAEQRSRNVDWAEAAVRESASVTATEARALRVIDLVARTDAELLGALDGRTVRLAEGRAIVLHTRGAEIRAHPMTIQQWGLSKLGDPNLAYALLVIGMLAIFFELFTPGIGVAGVVGATCLVLAAIGLDLLPVQVGAVILVAVGMGFFVAELFVTSYGLLALAGLVCSLAGAALLFDRSSPEFLADASVRLSWWVVVPLALLLAGAAVALGIAAARRQRQASQTGAEGMLGEVGSTLTGVDARGGTVRVHGERWRAVSDEPLTEETPVRVIDVRGLTLRVTRTDEPHGGVT